MTEINNTVDFTENYPVFDDKKRKDYTLLIPDMLPWHFEILCHVLKQEGYNGIVLKNDGRSVVDEGLKNVHNDACYPALLVVGQFIDALKSGKYDLNKTAVLITQTGGGCRASNYIALIRKALKNTFPTVPVVSLNFSGLDNGLHFSVKGIIKLIFGLYYGDTIMTVYNQVKPYEINAGDADVIRKETVKIITDAFDKGGYLKFKKIHKFIFERFKSIPVSKEKKTKVGIVGEIFIKYSPLGNNHLEDFLLSEGCEPVLPPVTDFVLYCAINTVNDYTFYGNKTKLTLFYKIGYKYLKYKQSKVISYFKKDGVFQPPHSIENVRKLADKVLSQAVKMGEGWLIPAEMAAFYECGTKNIVCAQPFGCLPNHIVGKGAIRTVRNCCEGINIVPVDYDPSSTKVNQENRIKLMLATAKENEKNK